MKVLISAYACEPGRGSEPGAGWAWACAAARNHDVWVLTHETNRASITAALAADLRLAARLHPIFLANSGWVTTLRRRGPARYLYYWIWQLGTCRREARRLDAAVDFDVCHHVTYASDWMPAGVSVLDTPFVWGPVGGSSTRKSPRLWKLLGWRTFAAELSRLLLLDPVRWVVGRRLARRAAVVLGQNPDVAAAFAPLPVLVEPNIALESTGAAAPRRSQGNPAHSDPAYGDPARRDPVHDYPRLAVYAGRLLGLKGLRLALAALARPAAASWRFDVYGDGPLRRSLERQAARIGVAHRVRFLGNRPRVEVRDALAQADVLLFPSIRDAAGWSVAEATSAGCPVVCLELGGPAVIVTAEDGVLIDPRGDVVAELAAGLDRARVLSPQRNRWSAERLPALIDSVYQGAQERACPTPGGQLPGGAR